MNLNNLMFQIKIDLGLLNIATPFSDLDGTIMKIIQEITIPTFSVNSPLKDEFSFSANDLEQVEIGPDFITVLLPDLGEKKILYVFDVFYDTKSLSGTGYYTTGMPMMGGNTCIEQVILGNAGANVINTMVPKLTFNFEEPRKLTLYNCLVSNRLRAKIGRMHNKNGVTIPETSYQSFKKLAILDVKASLYPTLKNYTELNTSIGNINLKLDEWANAEQERKDFIDKWDDTYHLDFQPFYWA